MTKQSYIQLEGNLKKLIENKADVSQINRLEALIDDMNERLDRFFEEISESAEPLLNDIQKRIDDELNYSKARKQLSQIADEIIENVKHICKMEHVAIKHELESSNIRDRLHEELLLFSLQFQKYFSKMEDIRYQHTQLLTEIKHKYTQLEELEKRIDNKLKLLKL